VQFSERFSDFIACRFTAFSESSTRSLSSVTSLNLCRLSQDGVSDLVLCQVEDGGFFGDLIGFIAEHL